MGRPKKPFDPERFITAVHSGKTREEAAAEQGLTGRSALRHMGALGLPMPTRALVVPPHGAVYRYDRYKCRCAECRAAWAASVRAMKAKRQAKPMPPTVAHGKASTYNNWNCRCAPCTEANTAKTRAYRAERAAA